MDIGHCISNESYELLYKSPEPVIKSVQKNYPPDSLLKLCLGVNNIWKNMYSISLPFTVKISYNKNNNHTLTNFLGSNTAQNKEDVSNITDEEVSNAEEVSNVEEISNAEEVSNAEETSN